MVLQVGLQPVLGVFGCVLGGQATKSNCPCEAKRPLCVNFELGGQISLINGTSCWPSPVMDDFCCVLGGQATKSTVFVRPKDIFCANFGQEGHLPTLHPGFGPKLSSKGKPGTCALLETLQSPVNFFRRAKLLGLLYKFCILPTYFCKY
jgi:hypothetical protein